MDTELETKAGIAGDALVTHGELMRAFEAFKAANDERLDEKRADVLLEEKVARIDAALDATSKKLDAITLKGARPALGRDTLAQKSAQEVEHKTAFESYVRAGAASGLRAVERKALWIGTNHDGG
jgi:HK97 family phage major capsid protein